MKHRKWVRFIGLTAACAISIGLGAVLSYQAAMQTEGVAPTEVATAETAALPSSGESIVIAAAEAPAVQTPPSAAPVASVDERAALEPRPMAPADFNRPIALASLRSETTPFFSSPKSQAAPLDLRGQTDPVKGIESLLQETEDAPLPPEPAPQSPEASALFHGKPAPLPPARPASLKAPVLAALPETPALPGAAPAVIQAPPQANPAATTPAAVAPATAKASPPAATVAAATSPGYFPSVANALAAVTSSVGGANSAVTPGQPGTPSAPDFSDQGGGFKKGQQAYVRIFKREGVLELWLKRNDHFALYKSYPVCKWSGLLGPKTRTADLQSPEGFYSVSARQLNPNSKYHLAFDVGYPNAYDRRQGSTGSAVMVHGDCKSVGCFAMTDSGIDEIYSIVEAALHNGQHEVPVHIFPFRMTEEAIVRESSPKQFMAFLAPTNPTPPQRDWSGFWRNLKQGYDLFERSHVPPVAYACGDRYEFGGAAGSCARIAGW